MSRKSCCRADSSDASWTTRSGLRGIGAILRAQIFANLVELTPAGRRLVDRHLLLGGPVAARHPGISGDRDRKRRVLMRNLLHTIGANGVFVALAAAARRVTQDGGDDALDEWRSAAACARGRCRPDGYGCYRRGDLRYGFFIVFDRGTERPREYAAKIYAYYTLHDSVAAGLDQ